MTSPVNLERFTASADQLAGCGHIVFAGGWVYDVRLPDSGRVLVLCERCVDSAGHAIADQRSPEFVWPTWKPGTLRS